jgi:hypothetical protein
MTATSRVLTLMVYTKQKVFSTLTKSVFDKPKCFSAKQNVSTTQKIFDGTKMFRQNKKGAKLFAPRPRAPEPQLSETAQAKAC